MSRFIFLLVALIVITGSLIFVIKYSQQRDRLSANTSNDPNFAEWHEYNSPTGQFKVLLPSLPQHASEKMNDPKSKQTRMYDMYVVEKDNGTLFMINLITYLENKDPIENDEMLAKVMNDMLISNPKNTLKDMQMVNYQNTQAMDFIIENDQIDLSGRTFILGKTLYVLTTVAKIENYNPDEFKFFINSFQLESQTKK